MKRVYPISEAKDSRALTACLTQHGQLLLPMVELIEQAQLAVDEFIEVLGRAALEAVLQLSAAQVRKLDTRHLEEALRACPPARGLSV